MTAVYGTRDYLVLDAYGDQKPRRGICRVTTPQWVSGVAYDSTIYLRNMPGRRHDASHGFVGVMYNVQDSDNFDLIIFRHVMLCQLTNLI